MTMMSSLKAFLFASPAQGAMIGGAAVPSLNGNGGDFAALLGGITQTPAAPALGGALPMPNPVSPEPSEGEARALPLDMQASPAVDMPSRDLRAAISAEAPILMGRPDAMISETETDGTPTEAEDDTDQPKADTSEAIPVAPVMDAAVIGVPAAALPIVPPSTDRASSPLALPAMPRTADAKAVATPAVAGKGEKNVPDASILPSAPELAEARLPSAVVSQARIPGQAAPQDDRPAASTARPIGGDVASLAPLGEAATGDRPAGTSQATVPQDDRPTTAIARPVGGNVVSSAPLAEAMAIDRPVMRSGAMVPGSFTAALPVMSQAPAAKTAIAAPSTAAPIIVATLPSALVKDPTLSMSGGVAAVDMPVVDVDAQTAITPMPIASAPVKSEALNLLQLVREHFVRREGSAATELASPVATASRTDDPVATDSVTATSLATSTPSQVIVPAPAVATGAIQAMPAAVDLGGTITGQVVDMGVQGQWIDGLAKDIAGLSTNGAQGRFQIRSDHLGAVQVDIRPSTSGTTVSLTVASDAAQQALQADGDRLIADAALSAMKITDLRVERGTINEAPRSDSAGQQNSQSQSQNPAQNGSHAMGQGQGQGLGQGQGQGFSQGTGQNRPDHRDNFSGNHKMGQDSAVLPQADSREGEATGARRAASRARYA